MESIFFAIGGYLIGSIPVAFLLARKRNGIDLRKEGSGNIGARNAFEVTGNKRLGFAVLILDMHKGIIPLIMMSKLGYCQMIPITSTAIILGHCYPIWLKFHGGRGLATGAAIALLISPEMLLCWIIIYFLSGLIRKQVHVQSLIATITCTILVIFDLEHSWLSHFRFLCPEGQYNFQYTIIGMLIIILSRHLQPVYEYLQKSKA